MNIIIFFVPFAYLLKIIINPIAISNILITATILSLMIQSSSSLYGSGNGIQAFTNIP